MRICSLVPGATEVVMALGLADSLVGISHECDYPPAVRRVPVMVQPAVDSEGADSADIDRQVKALTSSGQPLYRVNERALAEARPDIILTQDVCHVCAVTPHELERAMQSLPTETAAPDARSPFAHRCDQRCRTYRSRTGGGLAWTRPRGFAPEPDGRRSRGIDATDTATHRLSRVAEPSVYGRTLGSRNGGRRRGARCAGTCRRAFPAGHHGRSASRGARHSHRHALRIFAGPHRL